MVYFVLFPLFGGWAKKPKAEITPAFITAYDIWKTGEITAVEAIEKANVPKTTFYRLVQKYEAQLTK